MKAEKYLKNVMTVGQLREVLEDLDQDTPILFSYNYGDHWRTQVAKGVKEENIEEGKVEWSDYHRSLRVVDEDSDEETHGAVIIALEYD